MFVPKGQPLAGTLIAISERGLDLSGNILCFLIGGPSPGQFTAKRTGNFDISDAVLLPSGDLLLLERKFSLLEGVGIRIRRIPAKSIVPDAVIDGPTIFEVDLGYEIDNMEGIDVHVADDGRHLGSPDIESDQEPVVALLRHYSISGPVSSQPTAKPFP